MLKKLIITILLISFFNEMSARCGSNFGTGFLTGAVTTGVISAASRPRYRERDVVYVQNTAPQQRYQSSGNDRDYKNRKLQLRKKEIELQLLAEKNKAKELELRERELRLNR